MEILFWIWGIGAAFGIGGIMTVFLVGTMFGIEPSNKTFFKGMAYGIAWPVILPYLYLVTYLDDRRRWKK